MHGQTEARNVLTQWTQRLSYDVGKNGGGELMLHAENTALVVDPPGCEVPKT